LRIPDIAPGVAIWRTHNIIVFDFDSVVPLGENKHDVIHKTGST